MYEKSKVIPDNVIEHCKLDPIIGSLYISNMGYFPRAQNHYRMRIKGSKNHILIFCVNGKGVVKMNGQKYTLKENCLCIIPANISHTYYADNIEPWSIYWIHFQGFLSASYIEWIQYNRVISEVNQIQHSKFIQYFNRCYTLIEKSFSRDRMIISSNLLGTLLSNISYKLMEEDICNDESDTIERCVEFMSSNLGERLDLKRISKELCISKSHLIYLFKEQTGWTPINYFIHLKIQKACKLLDETQLNVKEIAYLLGYKDPLYFGRIFKKVMGNAPSTYRKINQG